VGAVPAAGAAGLVGVLEVVLAAEDRRRALALTRRARAGVREDCAARLRWNMRHASESPELAPAPASFGMAAHMLMHVAVSTYCWLEAPLHTCMMVLQ
jgi:hypothetical protein